MNCSKEALRDMMVYFSVQLKNKKKYDTITVFTLKVIPDTMVRVVAYVRLRNKKFE